MTQIAHTVEAPYQGVSQAPPSVRDVAQAEAVEDTYLSIPQGAAKRPPFSWTARLGSHPGDPLGSFDYIPRNGAGPDALLAITNAGGVVTPRVYDTSGLPRGYEPAGYAPLPLTITPAAQAYLNSGNPSPGTDFAIVTVEDYTFISNRKVTVGLQAGTAPVRPFEAMVWVRLAAYGRTFSVTVTPAGGTPVTSTLHTPNGAASTDSRYVDTNVIAQTLYSGGGYSSSNDGSASGNLTALTSQGFTVTLIGPVIYISHPTIDFTVDVQDGQGGTAMPAIKGKVQSFADLPIKSVDQFTVRITQTGSELDDYFVKYVATASSGTGVWQETIAPGAPLGLDLNTMPVGVFYKNGSWQCDVLPWKPRKVGDATLAPDPDFVGDQIRDITFWRGRLALCSAEAVALSSSLDPFRFYPDTLSVTEDSDPLILISPFPQRSTFRYLLAFEDRLMAFGDLAQAAVTSNGVLTPSTGRIDVVTTYEFSSQVRPIASNGKVYFTAPHGLSASTVYEVQTDRITNTTSGEDMTGAIPRYLPAGLDHIASCPVNYLAVYAKAGTQFLYPHLFRYAEQQRVQNAWSRWRLPAGWVVGGCFFRNTTLYVLACYGGEAHLLLADYAPDLLDPDPSSTILTHLDFRVTPAQVSFAGASPFLTSVNLPFPVPPFSILHATVAAPGTPDDPEGFLLGDTMVGALPVRQITVPGDITAIPFWIGFQYSGLITLTRFYAIGSDNRPQRSGRLSIRSVTVDLADTGYLRAVVQAAARAPFSSEFTGYVVDNPNSQFDVAPSLTQTFKFPVQAENEQVSISLVNDSHFGSKVLGMEWIGEFNPRAAK